MVSLKRVGGKVLSAFSVCALFALPVAAQDGFVADTGSYFEVVSPDHYDIQVTTSDSVAATIISTGGRVLLDVETVDGAYVGPTSVTMCGFPVGQTVYMYDAAHAETQIIADGSGCIVFDLDASTKQSRALYSHPGTILIPEDQSIGTWDSTNRVYKLNDNVTLNGVSDYIKITESNFTLDGDYKSITVSTDLVEADKPADAIFVWGLTGVSVKNLTIHNAKGAVAFRSCSDVSITGVDFTDYSHTGVFCYASSNVLIENNSFSSSNHQHGGAGAGAYFYANGTNLTVNYNQFTQDALNPCLVMDRTVVTVTSNVISGGKPGVRSYVSNGSVFHNNEFKSNDTGLLLDLVSRNHDVRDNLFADNTSWGVYMRGYCSGNAIVGNSFVQNGQLDQIASESTYENTFFLPKPTGGNFYDNWAGPDADNDGFVDDPYVFLGGVDSLPIAAADNEAPVVSDVVADPTAVNTQGLVTALVSDIDHGGSLIDSAEYSLNGGQWIGMSASDVYFDNTIESVEAIIAASSVTGVNELCVRGADEYGNLSTAQCVLYPVYDPEGGFVTGGGWIYSAPGAYTEDPSLEGKANFGFVSKYKKGADIPVGETQFSFKASKLKFHSSSYEWLVVSGAKAKYKGEGSLNGETGYKFMLTAFDADENKNDGHYVDRFRIKIYTEDELGNEAIVYDNGLTEADETSEFTTELGGGSIKIHTKKK